MLHCRGDLFLYALLSVKGGIMEFSPRVQVERKISLWE